MRTDLIGYALYGPSWATTQVPYYVNPTNIYVSEAAAISAIQSAASAWTQQSQANIQLVYSGQTTGTTMQLNNKNEVFFRNDSDGYIGETYWWYDGTGHLVDADIVLHEAYTYFAGSGCSNGIYIEDVTIHEFGHALGLGHSEFANTTMESAMPGYCDTSQETLEADDISGIRSLYPPTASSGGGGSGGQVPATPSGLVASVNPSTPVTSLLLSWSDNANNETGYSVERSSDGRTFTQIAQAGANAGSWTDTGLSGSATYYYRVRAFNNYGNSAYSNSASAQTQADPAPASSSAPTSQSSLTARGYKVKGIQTVELKWSGLSASSVKIYRNGTVISSSANDGVETDSINKKGGGVTYTYQVCAADGSSCTSSASVSF